MMANAPVDDAFQVAREAMEAFVRNHCDDFGPWTFDDDGDLAERVKGALLSEWVMVSAWVNPEDGETYVVTISSENMPEHHRVGLMHVSLDD